jgi:RNase P subunit RPR2
MKIYHVGEKSKGLCKNCKKLVPTTFKICSVPLSSEESRVDNILAAKCDLCDHIVSIPQQSATSIEEHLKEISKK